MEFIAEQLPAWRDYPDRPDAEAEIVLTDQLCSRLNSACYGSDAWSHVQFRTETRDETKGNRNIDLTPKPLAATIFIENRRHTEFDALFPIECKRLPIPAERDEREYVTNEPGTTGGIQRFKFGFHGASHSFGAMIGYVQKEGFDHWFGLINGWITDLAKAPGSKWTTKDALRRGNTNSIQRYCTLESEHERANGLSEIALHHVWISMN